MYGFLQTHGSIILNTAVVLIYKQSFSRYSQKIQDEEKFCNKLGEKEDRLEESTTVSKNEDDKIFFKYYAQKCPI